jgi:NTP pyrophosphatase (non-canonical NTP hydrolase)
VAGDDRHCPCCSDTGGDDVSDELAIERMGCVLDEVAMERRRQERKGMEHRARGQAHWRSCADPLLPTERKLAILGEEFGEVAKALNEEWVGNPSNLRDELVHVAAVAVAWAESLAAARAGEEDE